MDRIKLITKLIVGFLTSLLLLILVVCITLKLTVFNKEYILNTLNKTNYYEKTKEEIQKDMERNLLSSGLDKTVLNDIINKASIKNDMINLIESVYSGNNFKLNTEDFTNKLKNNIDEYLKTNNITVTDKKSLEAFENKITNVYEEEIAIYGYLNDYANKFVKIGNIILILIPILTLLIIISLYLTKTWLKSKYSGVVILSTSLMLLYIKFYIIDKIDIQNLLIISEPFSDTLKVVLTDIKNYIIIIIILLIIISLILNIKNSFKRKRKIKKIT